MWNLAFKFNEAGFADQLNRIAQAQNRTLHATIKEQGGLLLGDIVRATPPRGRYALAATAKQEPWATQRRIGEHATKTGVESALKFWPKLFGGDRTAEDFSDPKSKRPSAVLYRLMRQGKFGDAKTLINRVLSVWPVDVVARGNKAMHNQLRRRGRVLMHKPGYVVASGPSVNAVVKQRVKKVGLGKSGWMKGAEVLGTISKFPKWITRHGANGAAYFSPPGAKVVLWVKNTMNYVADNANELRIITLSITSRRAKLEKQIEQTIAANFRKQRREARATARP